jgi:peptide/nickel transport system substrate-binding protein
VLGNSKWAKIAGIMMVAVLAISLATSCAAPPAPPAPPEPPAAPLIIGTTDSVTDLDPANAYDFHTWEVFESVMDPLLTYVPGTTDLQPGLAEAMPEVSADGLEYTFTLREGLVFPDGEPVDANAVKWSIDRVFALEGDPNWLVTSFVDHVEVVDDLTVKFVLSSAVPYFPLLAATQPYTPVSPECYPEGEIAADSTCSGHGHFKITRWERDIEMELEQNEDYYGTAPAWPNIIIKYFEDATTMRLALENGEIDVAWKTLAPTDYPELEANPDLVVTEGPGAYIRYICFNVTTPPFDQAEVRQAIAAAIDRELIAERVYLGTHGPLYSMVPMGMWSHIDAFAERDLDTAKSLLEGAGYSEDDPLVMDLWYPPEHYGPTEADVAAVLKESLEETGMIEVTLQYAEWATYIDNMGAGVMPVFTLGWYPDYLDPDNYTWSWGHSEASDDMGIFYESAEMDAILEAGQVTTPLTGDERLQLYHDAQELWTEDVPTIPFTQGQLLVVTQSNVTGVTLDPTMFLHYFLLAK